MSIMFSWRPRWIGRKVLFRSSWRLLFIIKNFCNFMNWVAIAILRTFDFIDFLLALFYDSLYNFWSQVDCLLTTFHVYHSQAWQVWRDGGKAYSSLGYEPAKIGKDHPIVHWKSYSDLYVQFHFSKWDSAVLQEDQADFEQFNKKINSIFWDFIIQHELIWCKKSI